MSAIWEIAESETTPPASFNSLPYTPLMQRLLRLRGFETEAEIQKFLFPSLDHLYDPFLMKGIAGASKRILAAIERGETILVHGDYDVDGITGAALLSRTLRKLNAQFVTFLPERKKDGYGVSQEAVQLAKDQGVSLFITVDCGITAFGEVKQARALGIDVIIIDHHRIHPVREKFSNGVHGSMPEAFEIINPLQEDCPYPFKELSACGLAFKLAQALLGRGAFEFLDLAALSSVCDIAPLTDENRILAAFGLEALSERRHAGFKSLCEAAGLRRKKILASDLGFILGPRINASGRMSSPKSALELLTTEDAETAGRLAQMLNEENRARQQEERMLLKQALQMVDRTINFNRDRVIVVWGEGWHEGVIGIVAQRLVEQFRRPSVVIALDGEWGKGSGRSVKGFHLFRGFEFCETFLEEFGGHELAAGMKIHAKNLEAFRKRVNEFAQSVPADVFLKTIQVDFEISLADLSASFLRELALLEPFGAGNPRPIFLTHGLRSKRPPERLGTNGLRWWVTDGVLTFEAHWRTRGSEISFPDSEPYAMVYTPRLDSWDGIDRLILDVKDAKSD
jgi:single-stranded-DNA-specific exonuclease